MEYGVTVYSNPTPVITARSDDHLWRGVTFGGGRETNAGVRVTDKKAMGYPPFWRAVNLIASKVAGLPLDCFRRDRKGNKKVDLRHPAQKLMNKRVSTYMSAYQFRETMTGLAVEFGNAYASIDRQDGVPVAMAIWNPQNVMVRVMDGELWYVTYIGGNPVRVPGRDMLHIRGLGPDGICGYPLLDLMAEALGVGMAAQDFGARFFGSGSNMAGVLMVPGSFNEEKIRNTIKAWNSMQTGLTQSHKIALLQDGVKYQPTAVAPEQAQFIQTREHEVRATVSNITGVPPHMLGDQTRTSHNSLESEGQSFLDNCLQKWLHTWEDECEMKLLTESQQMNETHFMEFNREALVQMSFRDKIEGIYKQTEMGLIDLNEGRRLLNLDELPEQDNKRYHPANWVVQGEEPTSVTGQNPPQTTPAQNLLQAIVTSSVTKGIEIEASKAIRLANNSPNFVSDVDEFYSNWTANLLPDITTADARKAIEDHAEQSRQALLNVAQSCTLANLKSNVSEVVVTWQDRSEALISQIMKAVR